MRGNSGGSEDIFVKMLKMIWPARYWNSYCRLAHCSNCQWIKNTPLMRGTQEDGGDGKQFRRRRKQRAKCRAVGFLAAQLERTHITWTLTHDELRWCERNEWYLQGKCDILMPPPTPLALLQLFPPQISVWKITIFMCSSLHPLKNLPPSHDQRMKLCFFSALYKV